MAEVYTLTMTMNERTPATLRAIDRGRVKCGLIQVAGKVW